MKKKMVPVNYSIDRETEKAVYCCVSMGCGYNTTRYMWIPKSVCEFGEYIATYNALNEPETYGKNVIGVAEWFVRNNGLDK